MRANRRNSEYASLKIPGFYAHTLDDRPSEEWQRLEEHLKGVADRAAEFSHAFNAKEWGWLAGLWHDLGKYSEAFQSYLLSETDADSHKSESTGRIDHSTAGARHAVSSRPILGHLLAFPIAGHHSGLLDTIRDGACLESRLMKCIESWEGAPEHILTRSCPDPPVFIQEALGRHDAFGISFFVRMIFSCLVDADFLDTEAFMNPEKASHRPRWPTDILKLIENELNQYIEELNPPDTEVNCQRDCVRKACLAAADRDPGIFSLTVPTGGGKTLSSLAFALKHAIRHSMNRIIYVVPFTSIIDQNADVLRRVTNSLLEGGIPNLVVEHHSNLDPQSETTTSRLASENWDAPLILTTGVQFYESLFANRSSRCRKLHNIANAVVILDEAQTIPVDLLQPCLKALHELQANYHATVVLCTATQPAIHHRGDFPIGLKLQPDHEIVPDTDTLFSILKRVTVEQESVIPDEDLTNRLMAQERVLCIVNTRGHARRLASLLGEDNGHFHLSALMCPQHRSEWLKKMKKRLETGEVCRVVSTRLIEAGVDIDFPVVFRAMAGLDSIAQAAGRCNRNGDLESGRVVVFESEDKAAERFLKDTASSTRQVLPLYSDPMSLEAVEHYFRLYYWDQSERWDAKGILNEFHLNQNPDLPFLFGFSRVASRFRLIEETGIPIIIPWGSEGAKLCDELRNAWPGPGIDLMRKLQRFTVQIPLRTWHELGDRVCETVHDQYHILGLPEVHYSRITGLTLENDPAERLIA